MPPEHPRRRFSPWLDSLYYRKIVLRILLWSAASCCVAVIPAIYDEWRYWGAGERASYLAGLCGGPPVIILHHTLRLWPRKWWLAIYEFVFSSMELAYIGIMFSLMLSYMGVWDDEPIAVTVFALWVVLAAACFLTFLVLLWDVYNYWDKTILLRPYNWMTGCHLDQRLSAMSLISGRFLLKKRFSTDNRLILLIRGAVAIICLILLGLVSFYAFIWRPFGVPQNKVALKGGRIGDYGRISLLSSDDNMLLRIGSIMWLKTIDTPVDQDAAMVPRLNDLWWFTPSQFHQEAWSDNSWSGVEIVNVTQVSNPYPSSPSNYIRSLSCNTTKSSYAGFLDTNCTIYEDRANSPLDLLITFNFSGIPKSVLAASRMDVYMGWNTPLDDIAQNMAPIPLFPGSHLYGIPSISVQDRFSDSRVGGFGISRQHRRLIIMDIVSLYPDTISPIATDDNTASLRLPLIWPAMLPFEQEYYEQTVLTGFALLGGIWTFVNGLFAFIFGSTLLLVLFGIKPLSIYGLVHVFRKSSLVDGTDLSPAERDRIVAMIKAHLLGIEDDKVKENELHHGGDGGSEWRNLIDRHAGLEQIEMAERASEHRIQ